MAKTISYLFLSERDKNAAYQELSHPRVVGLGRSGGCARSPVLCLRATRPDSATHALIPPVIN